MHLYIALGMVSILVGSTVTGLSLWGIFALIPDRFL
jgi:hypothetical protein